MGLAKSIPSGAEGDFEPIAEELNDYGVLQLAARERLERSLAQNFDHEPLLVRPGLSRNQLGQSKLHHALRLRSWAFFSPNP
jgi:hypothetical protein